MTILSKDALEMMRLDCKGHKACYGDWHCTECNFIDTIADKDKQIQDLRAKVEELEGQSYFTCPDCHYQYPNYYDGLDCTCGRIHLCSTCYLKHKPHDGAVKEPEAVMPDSSSSGRVAFLLQPPRENQDEQADD